VKEVKPSRQEPRVLTIMRLRRSVSDVAQELLDEALRMRQCPGIYFADEPSGRTAKIGGTVEIRILAGFEKPSRNYRKLK
jgi:hypothetical protein